jgi:DNA-binding transcriptional LysR family regulator
MRKRMGLSERRLRYFFEAVTAGSIRAAADTLELEPSVLSRQIQQLEIELGVTLLERRGRGVAPTEAAQFVIDCYRQRLAGEETLLSQLEELNGLQRGQIHLVAGEGFIEELINVVLNDFCLAYPKINVTLELLPVTEVVRRVAEDKAHIGLAFAPQPDPMVRAVARKRHPICIIAGANHPLASHEGVIKLNETLDFSFGLMMPHFGLGRLAEVVEFSEKVRFKRALATNSVAALKHYVSTGLGLTLLPAMAVAREVASGEFVALRTSNRVFEGAEGQLILRDNRTRSGAVDLLLKRLATMSAFRKETRSAVSSRRSA